MNTLPKTFAERRLEPLGYAVDERHERNVFTIDSVTMSFGEMVVRFECVCPAYPTIRALGCSLHHEGPGDSWPVVRAEELAMAAQTQY